MMLSALSGLFQIQRKHCMNIFSPLLAVYLCVFSVAAMGSEWISDGRGCKTWNPHPGPDESVSWSGQCQNGYTEGLGKLQWFQKGKPVASFEGTMKGGKADGAGKYVYSDGRSYEGEWKAGRRNGWGELISAKGERYIGEWKNDKRVGLGELKLNTGLLKDVITYPSEGAAHVPAGQRVIYKTDPPTSGAHEAVPTPTGYYTKPQRPEKLVHALEHGIIVIYYDKPDPAMLLALQVLPVNYPGAWDGVIVTPRAGLGKGIILTAWTKMLRMQTFDPATLLEFIDSFRAKGPERPQKR
jgi:hypothetical protein